MTWCNHYQITLKANMMTDLLSRSNQFQSTMVTASAGVQTDLSQVVHSSCRSFATHLNHKVPLYMSPVPDQNAWDIDALNITWSSLTAYAYPPTALLHRVIQNQAIQLPNHCNNPRPARDALVLGPSAALNREHTYFQCQELFSNSPTIMCSTASQPPPLVSRSGQF